MLELEHARQLVDFKMPEAACQLDACLENAARVNVNQKVSHLLTNF